MMKYLPVSREALIALNSVRHATEQVQAAEVAQAMALVAAADLYRVDEDALCAGIDRMMRGGADGTRRVSEFLACELAGLLGVSAMSAANRVAEALDLRDRHPRLWQAFLTGRVRRWQASRVSLRCAEAGLSAEAADWVDRQLAAAAAIKPWGRVLTDLEALIVAVDPALAAERARAAAERRTVGIGPVVDGHCDLWGRLDAPDAIDLDHALDALADTLDPNLPRAQRRAAGLGQLARGCFGQHPLPRPVELVVHLPRPDTLVATVDRWGPLLRGQLADVLAGCRVIVRPVIDPAAVTPVDAYQVPDPMRLAVCERNSVDVFPYGTLSARSCDLDHTIAFDHAAAAGAGQTRPDNLGPLSRRAHRAKTHAGWTLTQPAAGVFEWTSPAGYRYRVDPHGTTRLDTPTRDRTGRATRRTGRGRARARTLTTRQHHPTPRRRGTGAATGAISTTRRKPTPRRDPTLRRASNLKLRRELRLRHHTNKTTWRAAA